MEKEIQRIWTEQKISFPEARKIVEGVIRKTSYASVAAKQVVSVGCQTDPPEVTSATGATNISAAPGATPTAAKPLANRDAKQAKNGKTQPHNIKDKSKETVNKPPIAAKPKQINKKSTNNASDRMPKGTDDPIAT